VILVSLGMHGLASATPASVSHLDGGVAPPSAADPRL
jgi:hypothetical protein